MSYTYDHPHMAVTVDVVVIATSGEDPYILMIRCANPPFAGMWALPGGYVGIDETIANAARRELREETGIDCSHLRFVGYFDTRDRDPRERTVSFAFIAEVQEAAKVQAADDASDAGWFPLQSLPEMAFDHATIMDAALAARRDG